MIFVAYIYNIENGYVRTTPFFRQEQYTSSSIINIVTTATYLHEKDPMMIASPPRVDIIVFVDIPSMIAYCLLLASSALY